jgi:hypothetical protein
LLEMRHSEEVVSEHIRRHFGTSLYGGFLCERECIV